MASYDAHAEGKELETEVLSGLHTANGNTKEQSLSSAPIVSPSGEDEPREAGDEVVRTVTGIQVRISAF